MVTSSVTNHQKEICPGVELLNQACLDLVAQIEQLKKENTLLNKMKEKARPRRNQRR